MQQKIKDIIKKLNIEVITAHGLKKDGLCLSETKTIFIREGLDECKKENIILHEIGHLMHSHSITSLSSPCYKMKLESEADDFWLLELVHDYLNKFDFPPDYIDIYKFLTAYQLDSRYYDKAKRLFKLSFF